MKHLRESILTSIGQGDRYFDELYNKYGLDPKKITINKDKTIDYDGDVDLSDKDIEEIPFKFNKVKGDFHCYNCRKLKTLEGCPKEVGKTFNCSYCTSLRSLKGGPNKIGEIYTCHGCSGLETLEGCSKEIPWHFYCDYCYKIKNLEGGPKKVGGMFDCSNCYNLESLDGCPREVGGMFYCKGYGHRVRRKGLVYKFSEQEIRKRCEVKGDVCL